MATPMFLIGRDKSQQQPQTRPPEPTKTRAKKTGGKNPNQKKQPQRGLGVAQLERLRLQERWKKITEMPPPPPPPPPQHFQSHSPFLLEPNFPLQFAGAGPSMLGNDCSGGGGGGGGGSVLAGFDGHHVVQMIGNGGFGSGGGSGLMAVETYPHGGGVVDPRVLIGNSVEASRELSSFPKFPPPPPPCVSDHCDICFKKKRVNNFNNIAKDHKNTTVVAAAETASFDFFGLSTNSAAELSSAGAIASNHYTDFGLNFNFNFNQDGAEINQLQRKVAEKGGGEGRSSSSSSKLTEYEFFPGKNGRDAEFEDLKMGREELILFGEEDEVAVMDHGEGSCITTTTSFTDIINGGGTSSSSTAAHLDLSLKLSF